MLKIIQCPICHDGVVKIEVSRGYRIVTRGAVGQLPLIARCRACHKKVKYDIQKCSESGKE